MAIFQGKNHLIMVDLQPKITAFLAIFQAKSVTTMILPYLPIVSHRKTIAPFFVFPRKTIFISYLKRDGYRHSVLRFSRKTY
jgi:hypothetical protein